MSGSRTVTLDRAACGRLDAWLAGLDLGVSRRELKQAFRDGRVRVAGRVASASAPAEPGAVVRLAGFPEGSGGRPEPELPLVVVYSDPALVVVDKSAGVPAYALRTGERGSVAAAVLARFPDLAGVGDLKLAPGLCHRLDRETSGLLLFARTEAAFRTVRAQFRGRRVHKLYQAVVDGRLEGAGVVALALGRERGVSRRMVVADGRRRLRKSWPARTRWRAIASDGSRTLVELVLESGVTHQARVHMLALGHPIVGDPLYGGSPHARLLLHARELGLAHPTTGAPLRWRSPHALSLSS